MAGFQIVEPSAGDTEWSNFSTLVNDAMQGFMALSLTNFDTTDVPLIAAGGKVEVAGSLYSFASTEAITGSLSTNQNYIKVTTSSSSITASYTTDAPTWVPSKSGWYDSSTGVQRYIGGSATDFGGKWTYGYINAKGGQERVAEQNGNTLAVQVFEIGVWDMVGDASKTVSHSLALNKVRSITATVQNDTQTLFYDFAGTINFSATEVSNSLVLASTTIFQLSRLAGDARFNTTNFDDTSINRGWVTCWYEI